MLGDHWVKFHQNKVLVLEVSDVIRIVGNQMQVNPYKTKFMVQMTEENKNDFLDFYLDESEISKIKYRIMNYNG